MNYQGFLKNFTISAAAFLVLIAGIVILFDPFYHYHAPLPGLKAVLTDKEYQCIGSLKNFDYDSVLAGSSVAENFNNRWFDEAFDISLIKAIRASGTTGDLCSYMDEAYRSREKRGEKITDVFYNLDIAALYADTETTFAATGQPLYLYNDNPFDDIKYLWNKDVLFEKIPLLLADSFLTDYDEGESYNWAKWKTFGLDMVKRAYTPAESVEASVGEDADMDKLEANLTLLTDMVKAHPETEFRFFFPPYSFVWWDEAYRTGVLERNLHGRELAMEALLALPNVRVYDFQEDEEVILNPDNYMDTLHFSADITRDIFDTLAGNRSLDSQGEPYEVHPGESATRTERMGKIVDKIEESVLQQYY